MYELVDINGLQVSSKVDSELVSPEVVDYPALCLRNAFGSRSAGFKCSACECYSDHYPAASDIMAWHLPHIAA